MDFFFRDSFDDLLRMQRRINAMFDHAFGSPSFWLEEDPWAPASRHAEAIESAKEENKEQEKEKEREAKNEEKKAEAEAKPEGTKAEDNLGAIQKASSSSPWLARWRPSFNISETENQLRLTAEIPGVDKKDVVIEVKDGVLTIKGEKREERRSEKENERYHRVERRFGSFARSIRLPEGTDPEKMSAKFENGVLEVLVEKPEPAKAKQDVKQITIQ